MSLESLLFNALKCHLVFAGSLQLAEGLGVGYGGKLRGKKQADSAEGH